MLGEGFNEMSLQRLEMQGNSAQTLIGGPLNHAKVHLAACAIYHNQLHAFIVIYSNIAVDGCTISDNTLDRGQFVFGGRDDLTVLNSIVWQPGVMTIGRDNTRSGNAALSNVLLNDSSIEQEADVVSAVLNGVDPQFIDAADSVFDLKPTSPAIDYYTGCGDAAPIGAERLDERGQLRGFAVRDAMQPCDLGAPESTVLPQPIDFIFSNGFGD